MEDVNIYNKFCIIHPKVIKIFHSEPKKANGGSGGNAHDP